MLDGFETDDKIAGPLSQRKAHGVRLDENKSVIEPAAALPDRALGEVYPDDPIDRGGHHLRTVTGSCGKIQDRHPSPRRAPLPHETGRPLVPRAMVFHHPIRTRSRITSDTIVSAIVNGHRRYLQLSVFRGQANNLNPI